jgi:hypothetical protein
MTPPYEQRHDRKHHSRAMTPVTLRHAVFRYRYTIGT